MSSLAPIKTQLAEARHPVIITGAGISAPSGISTFRKTGETSWSDAANEALTQLSDTADLEAAWAYWGPLHHLCAAALPNPAHLALVRWESWLAAQGGRLTILTQNVDELHQRAGSQGIFPVHGSLAYSRCLSCGDTAVLRRHQFDYQGAVPYCRVCEIKSLRPDIVLFGEDLHHLDTVNTRLATADLLVVVGTSGTVSPVNQLPSLAAANHIPCILINESTWDTMTPFGLSALGNAAEILPLVCPG